MEKLQKALQKAREQRGSAELHPPAETAFTKTAETATGAPEQSASAGALWQAMTPFEPTAALLERSRIVTAQAGAASTSYDILRTKILLTMRKNGWKRLAVTSPTPSCGKTTTACNLAIGYARNPDVRLILMEFDLRRPSIAKTLGLPVGPKLSDMLSGQVAFGDQAVRYRSNVAISAAHEVSADPSSVLFNRATHTVLQDIEDRYEPDILMFDLPPLLVSDDTRAVLKDVDCAILVARSGSTTVSQIDTSEREIAEHTNVLGVVLNDCRDPDDQYGYYEAG
jgi:protein-tyrosine kinase